MTTRSRGKGSILLLSKEADIRIVRACDGGKAAVRLAGQLRPDVILMDVSMPGMDGIEATKAIHARHPEIRIIGLSMLEDATAAAAMEKAGVVAYIPKSMAPRRLVQTMRAVARRR